PRGARHSILELYRRRSTESLYSRFRGIPALDEHLVERYLEADGHDRAALIGTREGDVVALGSFDRLRDLTSAEVAFTVDDRMQGHGVGTRLLEQLIELAAPAGIRRFVAEVSPENHQMLAVFRDAG